MNETSNESAVLLDSATAGRLEFVRGAYNLTIHAGASTADLYRARFEGNAPDIRVKDGTVRVAYPRSWNPLAWRRHSADVALTAAVPWEVEVRGGAARIDADLSGPRLKSFEIDGGGHNVELTLPEPSGTVSIRVEGGANSLRISCPRGVPARLHVGGGASKLAFDEQRLGAVGGETTLGSSGHAGATDPVRDYHHRRRQRRVGARWMKDGCPTEKDPSRLRSVAGARSLSYRGAKGDLRPLRGLAHRRAARPLLLPR